MHAWPDACLSQSCHRQSRGSDYQVDMDGPQAVPNDTTMPCSEKPLIANDFLPPRKKTRRSNFVNVIYMLSWPWWASRAEVKHVASALYDWHGCRRGNEGKSIIIERQDITVTLVWLSLSFPIFFSLLFHIRLSSFIDGQILCVFFLSSFSLVCDNIWETKGQRGHKCQDLGQACP